MGKRTTKGLDIIGDVHGHAAKLEERLTGLGYEPDGAGYRHPDRTAVFVGDLVDRGPQQLRTLEIAKAMVESGAAKIVMGNHEFNALAYEAGLREHNEKHNKQHAAFLDQLSQKQKAEYLDWFWTIPLWLDLGDVRIVHACWHRPSIEVVEEICGGSLLAPEQLAAATAKGDPLYEAVEVLLKGPEICLADYAQPPYVDKDGNRRINARMKWWHRGATTLRELAVLDGNFMTEDGDPYPMMPDIEVDESDRSCVYNDEVPVIYGHYWRTGVPVHLDDWTAYTACVDFSAAKDGTLVVYRWNGEAEIELANYVPHGVDVVEQAPAR